MTTNTINKSNGMPHIEKMYTLYLNKEIGGSNLLGAISGTVFHVTEDYPELALTTRELLRTMEIMLQLIMMEPDNSDIYKIWRKPRPRHQLSRGGGAEYVYRKLLKKLLASDLDQESAIRAQVYASILPPDK